MIAAWMMFSVLTGCAFAVAAAAGERLAAAWHRPRRLSWVAALAATALWPVLALIRPTVDPAASPADGFTGGTAVALVQAPQQLSSFIVTPLSGEFMGRLDIVLIVTWFLLTGVLLARLIVGAYRVRLLRRMWEPMTVDGIRVHVAGEDGPAVVGFPMDVVLPVWALALDRPQRALVLSHEVEHRTAGDPYLLLAAAVLTALFPWNLALWWQARRLRLAIEVDCDARVLRVNPRPDRYALLLLEIAERRSGHSSALVPALLEPMSNLERRITVMRSIHPSATPIRVLSLAGVMVVAIVAACSIDAPDPPTAPTPPTLASSAVDSPDPATGAFLEYQVEKPASAVPGTIRPVYPASLRAAGVEGDVRLEFVVDTAGLVEASTIQVTAATNELFATTVLSVVPLMRFHPAELGGRRVRQHVEQPITFRLSPLPRR